MHPILQGLLSYSIAANAFQISNIVEEAKLDVQDERPVHLWKNPNLLMNELDVRGIAEATLATADVYLMRHGRTLINSDFYDEWSPFDLSINEHGVQQAVAAQEFVEAFGLSEVPDAELQIASGLHARSFDTMVIAMAPLWRRLVNVTDFRIHEVPAFMEMDQQENGYSDRSPGLETDDPVQWRDSVLNDHFRNLTHYRDPFQGEITGLLLEPYTDAKQFFYKESADAERFAGLMTQKPVEVRSAYERIRPVGADSERCETNQMWEIENYLVSLTSSAGKRHIAIVSNGHTISCIVDRYGGSGAKRVNTNTNGTFVFNGEDMLGNGNVLHLKMSVAPYGKLILQPELVWVNPYNALLGLTDGTSVSDSEP